MDDAGRSRLDIDRADAEQAIDAADNAADRSADDGADWSGNPVAFIRPMDDAARNTLSLSRQRHDGRPDNDTCNKCETFHARTPISLMTPSHASITRHFNGYPVAATKCPAGLSIS
jgi:hypothetical protein